MNWSASTVLVIAFLFGTVLVEATEREIKRKQRKIKPQTSRKNYDDRYERTMIGTLTTNSGEISSDVYEALLKKNYDDDKDLVNFNYETLWRNGSRNVTRISLGSAGFLETGQPSQLDHVVERTPITNREGVDFNSSFWPCLDHQSTKRRFKRLIFGRDSRIRLNTSSQAQKFPFSSTVKISTGCSGSVISHIHVLTSAHCVHDGVRPLEPIADLKVGILRRHGKLRWIGVKSINFPEMWRLKNISASFDYAVITLLKPHKRPFFKLGVIENEGYLYKLHFASFPGDKKSNSLWYSHCYSRVISHLLIGRCDASSGSSGAGTYVRTSMKENGQNRVLVGILSGSGRVRLPSGRIKMFNLVTKLTSLKTRQICRWIGAGYDCVTWSSKSVTHRLRSLE